MKRIHLLFISMVMCGSVALAQPAKSRTQSANAARRAATSTAQTVDRASLQFPTNIPMPQDVVWRRDIYRQLDLTKDKNAPMYYPVEPMGRQVNLFTYLFRLVLTGRVKAYKYNLDGVESFEKENQLDIKDFLTNRQIYFEEKNGRIVVADADVPSAEVTRYYIKESVYVDQHTGTFKTRVTALCPVLMTNADDFSMDVTPYPLFWINYEDVATWLSRLPMMGSNLNNVMNLTANDFFEMNRYEGTIYKTNNMQGKVLAAYCTTDSLMLREQKKIEKQLSDFEKRIWTSSNDSVKKDSVVVLKAQPNKKSVVAPKEKEKENTGIERRTNAQKSKSSSHSSSSSAPRVSARRQRR